MGEKFDFEALRAELSQLQERREETLREISELEERRNLDDIRIDEIEQLLHHEELEVSALDEEELETNELDADADEPTHEALNVTESEETEPDDDKEVSDEELVGESEDSIDESEDIVEESLDSDALAETEEPAESAATAAEETSEAEPEEAEETAASEMSATSATAVATLPEPAPQGDEKAAGCTSKKDRAKAQSTTSKSAKSTTKTAPKRHPFHIRRVDGVDGLRGLAVIAVVIYHFFGNVMPGGFLGVDLFFVLSGFLITSLLIRERAVTGRIDLKDFWLRRLRRIFPAAVFVLFIGIAAAGLVGGDAAVSLPTQFLGTLFFVNNWTQIAGSESYFADSGVQVFAHYWSLAVEEQFYLLWPLIFTALGLFLVNNRRIKWAAIAGAVLSAVWMVIKYDPSGDPTRVYYGTDTHAFGLLLGAALALWITSTSNKPDADSWPNPAAASKGAGWRQSMQVGTFREPRKLISFARNLAPLALVIFAVMLFKMHGTDSFTYRGGLLLSSLVGTAMLYAVVRGMPVISQIFNWRLLRWFGKVSFSLYLWHWPVIVLLKEIFTSKGQAGAVLIPGLLALVISIPLSALSYRWVETPVRKYGYIECFRRLTNGLEWSPKGVAVPVSALLVVVLAVVAMFNSPNMTQLERDLAAAQDVKMKAEQAEKAELLSRKMPTGDQITAIGDSVMLASSDAIQTEYPEIYIDAAVSRHYEAVPPILDQMESDGTLDPFVVLGFGTNGVSSGAYEGLLDDILDQLGTERIIVLTLPYGDRYWMPDAEAEVLAQAKKRKNVYVADWCHAVRDNTNLLRSDLIHPTPEGATAYVDAISAAFRQWVDNNKEIPGRCGV